MKNQLNQLQGTCKKCFSQRIKLNFEELPEEMKEVVREINDTCLKFFQCQKCNETSISFSFEYSKH